ncbi:glycosyltransferase [Sphingomonas nostoxanthinifaciens]|uniref:glycosyltransferase n=1 Tax=Sphingomonas nostoxanthinifaciens TaxID=2872652 RepID=UPI001CC20152|nr:glycosyltransferase [Sphingomonas nostoxanthinifaciens]UAK22846.1 glycosyltransferase [Sphingomonas nostoxanthinifaciens]
MKAARRDLNVARDMAEGALSGGVLLTIHRLSQGGADRVAMLLANGFAAINIPTGVAVFRGGGEGEDALLDLLRDDVALSSAGPPTGSRHVELVRGYHHIRRQIAVAKPAFVLASSSNMGVVTGLAARAERGSSVRFAMKLTNPVIRPSDRSAIRKAYRRRLYRFIFGSFDRVLILSDAERANLVQMFPEQASRLRTVINPYISEDMLATPLGTDRTGPPLILTLARMMPQKRLDRLLRAFARVNAPAARLAIVGDGPERDKLEQLARTLGIADRVDMPGFATDVLPWLQRADLFALSSDYEGLPAAALEALACGVPVVTTDCFDAAHAILAGIEGCAVVPRDDVQALATALDEGLAAPRDPGSLRDIARAFSVSEAIRDHAAQLGLEA